MNYPVFNVSRLRKALAALGFDDTPGDAEGRPAPYALGELLALAEFIVRVDVTSAAQLEELATGYTAMTGALSTQTRASGAALRAALAEDRLRRTEAELNDTDEDEDTERLRACLNTAVVELGRRRSRLAASEN